ncbi:MAG: hypothetical protein Ta2B_04640 [Termitinemataceae bacterium]|nr:MAG: hypothetical protein Ta2B_04640 [Termitinemataceae bacterium]
MKNKLRIITIVSFIVVLIFIAFLIVMPDSFFYSKKTEFRESRLITPTGMGYNSEEADFKKSQTYYENSIKPRVDLNEGEVIITVLTDNFDNDPNEEQIISYRNLKAENSAVYITYIVYDAVNKTYKRLWSLPTEITQPATLSIYSEDLIGDRSKCIIVTGMNNAGERIMVVYRNGGTTSNNNTDTPITKIADIKIDGTISVVESERTQAYHLGMTNGKSYTISAHGRDESSRNTLDQIEVTYVYNSESDAFQQNKIEHIAGAQIEAKKLRELLNGNAKEFEKFIDGLWYHVSSDGTVDNSRYVYFDTNERELIFYDEDTQQVYNWLGSNPTRYGLYISSQNISVATLRRIMDIELETLESIRLKVFEDVRMKVQIDAPWDGSYKKAKMLAEASQKNTKTVKPYLSGRYLSQLGDVEFFENGEYQINSNGNSKKGKYIFFALEDNELLELLPYNTGSDSKNVKNIKLNNLPRETFKVIRNETHPNDFTLERIKMTTRGLQEYHETVIVFTKGEDNE